MRRRSALALLAVALVATQPNNCNRACFGWAGSELGDVDRDHTGDWITSEPFTANGSTYVYWGRTGQELYRFDGAVPGAQQGYAIADAGDVDRDHVTDILTTAPGDGAGHVYVYSGRTGGL